MPHFFAKTCEEVLPKKVGEDYIICESKSADSSLIILKTGNEYILLTKIYKDNKFLIKYNRNSKSPSLANISRALKLYASESRAKILTSSFPKTRDKNMDFLLNYREILTLKSPNIEIGFGSGRHLINLAKSNKNEAFLGIEIYRPAIEQVLRQIEILSLKNLFLFNGDSRALFNVLPQNFAKKIFLHFPVPWEKNEEKRVISAKFLDDCAKILESSGFLELRTDSKEYFDFTLNLANNFNVEICAHDEIISKYEARWLRQNKEIFCARFFPKNSESSEKNPESIEEILGIIAREKLDSKKHIKKDYFLCIKNIFDFADGFVVFVVFGAYYAPSSAYLLCYNFARAMVLGDIIPSDANVCAIKLLMRLYGK